MDTLDLEKLRSDIEELRRAVRRSNPFLRSIMEFRSYAVLGIVYGVIVLAYCLGLHFLALGSGSPTRIPAEWELAAWVGLAATTAIGMIGKLIVVNRNVGELEEGATILSAARALYEGLWGKVNAPLYLFMPIAAIFAIASGHAWYVESALAIGFSLMCSNYGVGIDRKELMGMGWYLMLAGLGSLFFIESAPFLWSAIIWAGCFFAYGALGLIYIKREKDA